VLALASHSTSAWSDVNLLISTGGGKRLDDFLLWENACSEIVLRDVMWPDFTASDLAAAAAGEFRTRERWFGFLRPNDSNIQTQLPSRSVGAANAASDSTGFERR